MKFRDYLESNNYDTIIEEVNKINKLHPNLPNIKDYLDSSNSTVFNTNDPNVIIRVGLISESKGEKILSNKKIQRSGGVVRILHIDKFCINKCYIVTWKERVDERVEWFLRTQYPENFEEITNILASLYEGNYTNIQTLLKFTPTKGLAKAIRLGMPYNDLALESNLGFTKDGRIVAFDC